MMLKPEKLIYMSLFSFIALNLEYLNLKVHSQLTLDNRLSQQGLRNHPLPARVPVGDLVVVGVEVEPEGEHLQPFGEEALVQ